MAEIDVLLNSIGNKPGVSGYSYTDTTIIIYTKEKKTAADLGIPTSMYGRDVIVTIAL